MAYKLQEWIAEEIEQEIMKQMWGDYRNKLEIMQAEAYEEIQKQSKIEAEKIMMEIKVEMRDSTPPATAERREQ